MSTASINRQPSPRPDLLVFEITGPIHSADMERMAEDVNLAIETCDGIDILLIFAIYDGASLGAVLNRAALMTMLRSNLHVRRYAVVGAPPVAGAMIDLFDPLTPIDARTFDLENIEEARAWIG